MQKESKEEIQRGWLFLNPENKLDCTEFNEKKEVEYKGLSESLEALKAIASESKVEAIFAFSQGSLLSLMLGILIETEQSYKELFKDLKCFILCAGFLDPYPSNSELLTYKDKITSALHTECSERPGTDKERFSLSIPVLNVFGEADEFIKPEKSKSVEKLFMNVESFSHPGKHFIPSAKPDIERYISFLGKYLCSE